MQMVVLTRAWPYPPGEQFITAEAAHWPGPDRHVTVMPWTASGTPIQLPEGLSVDLTLARATRTQRRRALARAMVSPLAWRDLLWLARHRRLTRGTLTEVLQATRNALLARDLLVGWAQQHGPIDVVYGYWFGAWTLGALLARDRGVEAVLTRVHGYDLHEDRHPAGFHALKRQLAPRLDALLPVSRRGGQVACDSFGVRPEIVHHAPLGVGLPNLTSPTSSAGEFHLLSVASALPVKRVDRLVEATALLARAHPEWRIHWTHIGGGALLDDLRSRAADAPDNLQVTWAGQLSSEQVAEHFATAPVDLFVNTSASEGVPVSIMEAMSHAVPTLAPTVGSIDEIVPATGPGGELLGPEPTPGDIAEALARWATRAKDPDERDAARRIVGEHYEAGRNARRVLDVVDALTTDSAAGGAHE